MRFSFLRRLARMNLLAVCLSGFIALAQTSMTVTRLVEFIRSTIDEKNSDKDTAAAVAKIRLTEKFTLGDLGDLQTAGVGPKTLSALAALVTQSAKLTPPPPKTVTGSKPAGLAAPSVAEQKQVFEGTRDWALNYVKSLPDFLCLQVTNRSVDDP